MCRWLAYAGGSIRLKQLLLDPKQNLIDQSLSSRSELTPTNGDGFGVGWYGINPEPGLFHSIRPAWNDFNLRDLASNIESSLFMAHVRATSLATIQETNCHPFRYKNWLFVHNGEIDQIQKFRRELLSAVGDEYFENILGSTDSELMFHLALTFGLQVDVPKAVTRMVGFIEDVARKKGVNEAVWMTLGISDGKTLWGFRYGSDGDGPSLYYSPDVTELEKVNPDIKGHLELYARCLVSEPIGEFQHLWTEVPQSSTVVIHKGKVDIHPFKPISV
ncbi:MAG: class II glutamine amidotransferase [Cyclobacteriaceae bacterium]|jgi:glutamine amidotransferase|nr:class II glutamine amidotransferase [Cyclobacteriaceae bacterium]